MCGNERLGETPAKAAPSLNNSNQGVLHLLGDSKCNHDTFIPCKHDVFELIFKLVKFLFLSLNLHGHATLTIQY